MIQPMEIMETHDWVYRWETMSATYFKCKNCQAIGISNIPTGMPVTKDCLGNANMGKTHIIPLYYELIDNEGLTCKEIVIRNIIV